MPDRPSTQDRPHRLAAHQEPVSHARFVDAARAERLASLGVMTIGDLIGHYPFRYVDLTAVRTLRDVTPGTEATVVGRVHEVRVKHPRPRLAITEVALVDGTGALIGVWFNQPWVSQRFRVGERVAFAGRVELDFGLKQMKTPFVERLSDDDQDVDVGRVLPVHRTVEGLSSGWLRRLVASAIDDFGDVCDYLPVDLRLRRGLLPLHAAIRAIHFPLSLADAAQARRRLAYDELLLLQVYMAMRRHVLTREQLGVVHRVDGEVYNLFTARLPFTLTDEQERAIAEILSDMSQPRPMNRMLMGDVGTGKTIVAAHALVAVADTGTQAAMMAPTEVLAVQYADKVGPLLDAVGVRWALLTGSTPVAKRREILAACADGSLTVLFGTHALLDQSVIFQRLSLAIVDEQHRFGVNQRLGLRGKGTACDLLVMTATPIPRSLALTLYGDLATSTLRSRPAASSHVRTHHVRPDQSKRALQAVRAAVRAGRQAYVVCALVEESETAAAKAAVKEAERLRTQVFADLRVGLLTGRMRPAEKAKVMDAFRSGEVDVLVATTVIEVGIDVPNATVMLIENAERFGLAQLHQLRGRVGRGEHPGEVWLIADPRSKESRARLEAFLEVSDGFELAERDLQLRGEGQLLGDRQHGLPDFRVASLVDDMELVESARHDAFEIVSADPHLDLVQHRPLKAAVKRNLSQAWACLSSG